MACRSRLDVPRPEPAQSVGDGVQEVPDVLLPCSSSRHNHIGAIEAQTRPTACGDPTGAADRAGPISAVVNDQSCWQHGEYPKGPHAPPAP